MRVLHLIKVTGIAGAEGHLLTLLAGLRQRGIDAQFLLLVEPGNPVDAFVAAAESRGIPARRVVIHHDADLTLFPRLWRQFRASRPEIVHTHLFHADLYGIPAARAARVPVVISSRHNDDAFRYRAPLRMLNWLLWRMVSGGIAISAAIARFSVEVEGAPAGRTHTVRYGLEPAGMEVEREAARAALRAELALPEDALLLGMVCRLVEQKGIRYAIEAFQRIAADFPAAHLVIAGEGPQREALVAQAAGLGVADRVHFLGWRTDAAAIFAALDIFLMPSLWEGFGLVLLEAMAQAVPVVGSEVSAIPEVVAHGETGLLCPPRDVAALAEALGELLDDPARRRQMGQAGRARLESHFNPARMVEETATLYRQYLGDRAR